MSSASKPGSRRLAAWLLGLALLGAAVAAAWQLLRRTELTLLHREGPPALVQHGGAAQLWVMARREERAHFGGSRFHTRYLLELRAFDARTGQRLWSRQLRAVSEHDGGHGAAGRILGQDGELVWLFVGDQPVAVAATDGAVRFTGLDIVAKNPALARLLVGKLNHHGFDGGLITVAADARRYRVRAPDLVAEAYAPENDEQYRRMMFMHSRWNGGYQTRDFLVPAARPAAGWLGLYTEAEAQDAGRDEFGDRLKNPWHAWRDDPMARRSFWTAEIGRTRTFSEGAHDRLLAPRRLPGSAEYLQGGLLLAQGTRQALGAEAGALYVLHRDRIDAQGRLQLSRLAAATPGALRPLWTAPLPIAELHNRWQWPDRLLMVGHADLGTPGRTLWHEHALVIDLDSGTVQGWNLTTDQPLLPPR
jgi:hypothetical protein